MNHLAIGIARYETTFFSQINNATPRNKRMQNRSLAIEDPLF